MQTLTIRGQVQTVVEHREKEYRHSIVTSQQLESGGIISHVKGSSWVVDYYAQLKGFNEEVKEYDPNQLPLNQQYHRIFNIELKLQSQSPDRESITNRVGVEGTAVVYAGVIPNVGDVIISDIGAGKAGRHTVTSVSKQQYMMRTVYEINYKLIDFVDTKEKVAHLDSFVVKTSVFDRNLLTYNNNPLILEEDYALRLEAQDVEHELIDDYLKEFFSGELNTLLVPGYDNYTTYDPYAVEALKEVVEMGEHPIMRRLQTLNMNELREVYSFSIWPVLLYPEVNKIQNIWKKATPINHQKFHMNPGMMSFRYSGIYQCMSPVEDIDNIDYYHGFAQMNKEGSYITSNTKLNIMVGTFGTTVGEALLKEVNNSNKACCHHLVHYHEAHPKNVNMNSLHYIDMVHNWVRATGHWDSCSVCGGCDVCCHCNDECDEATETDDDKYLYVLSSKFWDPAYLDDQFSAIVRSYLNGDRISFKILLDYIKNRRNLDPKTRYYHMLVMLIILRSALRSN